MTFYLIVSFLALLCFALQTGGVYLLYRVIKEQGMKRDTMVMLLILCALVYSFVVYRLVIYIR